MHLELLIDDRLDLLHGFQDQEPRLDIQDVTQTVRYVEECLAYYHIPLIDIDSTFTWLNISDISHG
jgi:hypothetical protein